jgi:hypothetical protein
VHSFHLFKKIIGLPIGSIFSLTPNYEHLNDMLQKWLFFFTLLNSISYFVQGGRRGLDCMVVGFTTIKIAIKGS